MTDEQLTMTRQRFSLEVSKFQADRQLSDQDLQTLLIEELAEVAKAVRGRRRFVAHSMEDPQDCGCF